MPGPNAVPHVRPQADSADTAPSRRRFLMGAAVAVAAADTAAATGHLARTQAPPTPATPATDQEDDRAAGYRLTEHIRKYYKTTWI